MAQIALNIGTPGWAAHVTGADHQGVTGLSWADDRLLAVGYLAGAPVFPQADGPPPDLPGQSMFLAQYSGPDHEHPEDAVPLIIPGSQWAEMGAVAYDPASGDAWSTGWFLGDVEFGAGTPRSTRFDAHVQPDHDAQPDAFVARHRTGPP